MLKDLARFQKEMAVLFKDFSRNVDKLDEYVAKARDLEHQADVKAHELIDLLNKTFITPIDREDLYLLAHELDEIIDLIENVIHNIQLYGMGESSEVLTKFADIIVEAGETLEELVDHFQELKRTNYLLELKVKVHGLEDQGDHVFQQAIQKLFLEEKDPVKIIKWKDILENLEEVVDQYQTTSDTIEGVIVKSS